MLAENGNSVFHTLLAALSGIPRFFLFYLDLFARILVLRSLSRLSRGSLTINEPRRAACLCFGQVHGRDGVSKSNGFKPQPRFLEVELEVHDGYFWLRLLLFGDIGFAQSYMLGEVTCSNLTAFFELFIANQHVLSDQGTEKLQYLLRLPRIIAKKVNDVANSTLNANAHYSLSNEMFAAFLSRDMTYSCPLWLPETQADKDSLEAAQMRKLMYTVRAARIKRSDHVLEIGTGWGSFAMLAVKETGCRVTTVTLSSEQKRLAEQRIAAEGLSSRIQVLLCDYRELPFGEDTKFDKIVSIEMIEHVGADFLDTYFECMNSYLKPQGGIAVFHCITMPETRYESYRAGKDFIQEYIFPGGHLPSVSALVAAINHGSEGTLIVDDIKSIGRHYSRALRIWKEQFNKNFESFIAPAVVKQRKKSGQAARTQLLERDVNVFRRKWEYYFSYCEAGFNTKTIGDVIITAGREGCLELLEEGP